MSSLQTPIPSQDDLDRDPNLILDTVVWAASMARKGNTKRNPLCIKIQKQCDDITRATTFFDPESDEWSSGRTLYHDELVDARAAHLQRLRDFFYRRHPRTGLTVVHLIGLFGLSLASDCLRTVEIEYPTFDFGTSVGALTPDRLVQDSTLLAEFGVFAVLMGQNGNTRENPIYIAVRRLCERGDRSRLSDRNPNSGQTTAELAIMFGLDLVTKYVSRIHQHDMEPLLAQFPSHSVAVGARLATMVDQPAVADGCVVSAEGLANHPPKARSTTALQLDVTRGSISENVTL